MADDISDEEARGLLVNEAREVARHIRAGTIAYDTDEYAAAAILSLIEKREFQVGRHLAHLLAVKIVEYPTDEDRWAEHLVAELSLICASLMQSYGEVEGR